VIKVRHALRLAGGVAGRCSPLHTHRDEDEYSVVLDGIVGVQIGQRVIDAIPGTVLVKPRGVPHAFWNPGDQPARPLEIISPAGFEQY
jgi:quercetin dioxygenase-like cupin family protein